eukprot:PhM_4_TR6082/c0_g1_i1/m.74624
MDVYDFPPSSPHFSGLIVIMCVTHLFHGLNTNTAVLRLELVPVRRTVLHIAELPRLPLLLDTSPHATDVDIGGDGHCDHTRPVPRGVALLRGTSTVGLAHFIGFLLSFLLLFRVFFLNFFTILLIIVAIFFFFKFFYLFTFLLLITLLCLLLLVVVASKAIEVLLLDVGELGPRDTHVKVADALPLPGQRGPVVEEELVPLLEKGVDALDIALKQVGGVLVLRRHHLGEIDDDQLLRVPRDHEVELVEIAVNQSVLRKAHEHVHALVEQLARVREVLDAHEHRAVDLFHDNGVAVVVNGLRHGVAFFVQGLHEGEFLRRRQTAQIEPVGAAALRALRIVTVARHRSEGASPETLQFDNQLVAIAVAANVDVALLPTPDHLTDARENTTATEYMESEVVVP